MVGSLMRSNVNLLTDYREQVYDGWAPTARQPLLPDRDAIATSAWSQAYSLSVTSPLEGEEEETILWPRGVGAYSVHLSDVF
jgi:hypothetical protein